MRVLIKRKIFYVFVIKEYQIFRKQTACLYTSLNVHACGSASAAEYVYKNLWNYE